MMKRMILAALAVAVTLPAAISVQAQDDDIYYSRKNSRKAAYAATADYVWDTNANSDWDVDAYNRRGNSELGTNTVSGNSQLTWDVESGTMKSDAPATDGVNIKTVYDTIPVYVVEQYAYSDLIRRFYNPFFCHHVWNPFYDIAYYDPFFWDYCYYDPWWYVTPSFGFHWGAWYTGWNYGYYCGWYGGWYAPYYHPNPHFYGPHHPHPDMHPHGGAHRDPVGGGGYHSSGPAWAHHNRRSTGGSGHGPGTPASHRGGAGMPTHGGNVSSGAHSRTMATANRVASPSSISRGHSNMQSRPSRTESYSNSASATTGRASGYKVKADNSASHRIDRGMRQTDTGRTVQRQAGTSVSGADASRRQATTVQRGTTGNSSANNRGGYSNSNAHNNSSFGHSNSSYSNSSRGHSSAGSSGGGGFSGGGHSGGSSHSGGGHSGGRRR